MAFLKYFFINTQLIVKNGFFIYLYVKLKLTLIYLINKAKRRLYI
jgi:hypothetical protein